MKKYKIRIYEASRPHHEVQRLERYEIPRVGEEMILYEGEKMINFVEFVFVVKRIVWMRETDDHDVSMVVRLSDEPKPGPRDD